MLKNITVYSELIKYKLSLAVTLSSVTGYYLYDNTFNHHLIFLASGIFLLASGSAVLNQYTERVADSLMERTRNRPIPSGKISEPEALAIFSLLFISGCFFLYNIGLTPLLLGIVNVLLYNLIYTYLKKKTIWSIVPGALVGAIPPLIGFTSAGGTILNHNILLFSFFMFLWQLPHFWLILIKYGKEYKTAGFATILNYLNQIQIRYLVFFWVILSTGFILFSSRLYVELDQKMFIVLSILNLVFIYFFYRMLFMKKGSQEIKGAFIMINSFTFIIMCLIIAFSVFSGF